MQTNKSPSLAAKGRALAGLWNTVDSQINRPKGLVAGKPVARTSTKSQDMDMSHNATPWSLRLARYEDAWTLATISSEAAKDQGLWPEMTEIEEAEWHDGFVAWSRESVDGPDLLQVVEAHGEAIGRLRTERDEVIIDGRKVPRITLCGIQLRPPFQRRGIGSAIIRDLQAEATSRSGVLDLGVKHANADARRLYERLGFVQFGCDEQEDHMRWSSIETIAPTT